MEQINLSENILKISTNFVVARKNTHAEKEIYKTKPREMASLKKYHHAKVVTPVEPRQQTKTQASTDNLWYTGTRRQI